MVTQQLFDYIQSCFDKSLTRDLIKNNLMQAGWLDQDIEEAFNKLSNNIISENNSVSESYPTQVYPGILPLTDLIKQSLDLYKKNFISLFLVIFCFSLLYTGLAYILLLFISKSPTFSLTPTTIIIGLVNMTLLYLFFYSKNIATYLFIKKTDDKIKLSTTFTKISKKIPLLILLSLISWIVMLLSILFLIPGLSFSNWFWVAAILDVIFLIPGIIFYFWSMVAPLILIENNVSVIDSIKESRKYVGAWWPELFSRFFLLGILYFIVILSERFLVKLLGLSSVFTSRINLMFDSLLEPFAYVFVFSIYQNLKYLKENNIKSSKKPISKFTIGCIVVTGLILLYLLFTNLISR